MKTLKLTLILIIIFISSGKAQTAYTWKGNDEASWSVDANWDPVGHPSSGDTAIFDNGVSMTVNGYPAGITFGGLKIIPDGSNSPTNVHFNFEAGTTGMQLNELVIDEGCSLNYDHNVRIIVNNKADFNQATLNMQNASIYLNGSTNISIDGTSSQNAFTTDSVVNKGILNLNAGELTLNCIYNNLGTLNLGSGILNVNKEFHFDINSFMNGTVNSTLNIASSVTYFDPLPELQLGLLISEANLSIGMTGNLLVENKLFLNDKNLNMAGYQLTINGEYRTNGAVLDGGGSASLIIGNGANAVSGMKLVFSPINNSLTNLILNRPGSIIDIEPDLYVENLDIQTGKLRFNYHKLIFNNFVTTATDAASYVITGPGGYVSSILNVGSGKTFPVGTEKYFANVLINPSIDGQEYIVNVQDHVYSEGRAGDLLSPDELVNMTWKIESPGATSSYDLQLEWDVAAQGTSFDLTTAFIAYYNGLEWTKYLDYISATEISPGINAQSLSADGGYGLYTVTSQVNEAPIVTDCEFSITEDTPNGTIIGTVDLSDPNVGQTVRFGPNPQVQEYIDAFTGDDAGNIILVDASLLDFAVTPIKFTLQACDNGIPIMCSDFMATMNLEQLERDIVISNYISPNNDGHNDFWFVEGAQRYDYDVVIFNKSGDIVYKSDSYKNDWDGTKNGTKLTAGVYYYLLKTADKHHKGTITLVR